MPPSVKRGVTDFWNSTPHSAERYSTGISLTQTVEQIFPETVDHNRLMQKLRIHRGISYLLSPQLDEGITALGTMHDVTDRINGFIAGQSLREELLP